MVPDPVWVGAVNATLADANPAVAVTDVGAPGRTIAGTTLLLEALGALVPVEFEAVTVNVYETPLVSPVT